MALLSHYRFAVNCSLQVDVRKSSIKLIVKQGDILKNISLRGPGFGALILFFPALAFIACLVWSIAPASAQVQTAVYAGPSFDLSWCSGSHGSYPPNICVTGSISASITYVGACPSSTNIISITASSGAGSLVYPGNYFVPVISCDFSGQIAGWQILGYADNSGRAQPYIAIASGPPGGATDQTFYASGCCYTKYGYVAQSGYGHWYNAKSLGSPATDRMCHHAANP